MALRRNRSTAAIALPEQDSTMAESSSVALAHFLSDRTTSFSLRLTNPTNGAMVETAVPAPAIHLLADALARLSHGETVTLIPLEAELSTQQAADLLRVSRPYLIKLLEQGKIPYRKVGEHRRVLYIHLQQYVEQEQNASQQAVDELVSLSESMGLYEMEQSPNQKL